MKMGPGFEASVDEQKRQIQIQTVEKSEKRHIPIKLQLAFGVGHVCNDICSSIWFSYLLIFLNLVLKFDSWQAGFLLLVGQVADAVANPIFGYLSDKYNNVYFSKYGKRKAWHLLGTLSVVGSIPFTFLPCLGCSTSPKWAQMIYYSVFIIILQFGWAVVQLSHLSLIPELAPDECGRTKLTATRYCFTVISNLLVYITSWLALRSGDSSEEPISPSDGYKFQEIMWVGLVIGTITSVIFHVFVKEHNDTKGSVETVDSDETSMSVGEILSNIKYYQAAIVYMSTMLFANMGQIFIPLYLHESLHMAATALAVIPLIIYVGSFVTSLFVERLNTCLGRKVSYIIGASIGLSACVWIQFRSNFTEFISYEIYAVAVVFGIGSCIIQVTNLGIVADLIGTKTNNGAFIYGIMTLTDKLSNGIVVITIESLRKYHTSDEYYRNVVSMVCGGAVILAIVAVISLAKRTKERSQYVRLP